MPRVVRNRERTRALGTTRTRFWVEPTQAPPAFTSTTRSFKETCSDRVGRPVIDGPLSVLSMGNGAFFMDVLVRGPAPGGLTYAAEHDGYYPSTVGFSPPLPYTAPSGWTLDLLAGTNPSRPVVTIPTLIQNFVELPRLIRDTGNYFRQPRRLRQPSQVASAYLGAKFGWLSMAEDLAKLMGVYNHALNRAREYRTMYDSEGGLRRRLKFRDDNTVVESAHVWSLLSGVNATTQVSVTDRRQTWATVRWKPTKPPPYRPTDDALMRLATRTVLGMTSEGLVKGLWDVIPWTWLLGWVTNVGKYAVQHSNTVPAVASNMCFMSRSSRTIRVGATSIPLSAAGLRFERRSFPAGGADVTWSTRVIGSGSAPSASIPFLDIGQLSVLGALAAQKWHR